MIQNPTLPMQQAAVQQQMQQTPVQACPMQNPAEFNAIKINIQGAQVGTPAQQISYPVPQDPNAGQQLNYQA